MNYPYWEYDDTKKEITIYYSEHRYCTYYDEDAEGLYKDLEFGTEKERQYILNEIYLDMESSDPYRRSDDLI
jgi:hypothetical protein